jgi:hypothetical protein
MKGRRQRLEGLKRGRERNYASAHVYLIVVDSAASVDKAELVNGCTKTRRRTREPDGACEGAHVRNDVGVSLTLENLS